LTHVFPAGKLPAPFLAELLRSLPVDDPRLLLGPAVGEDAAVIDFAPGGETLLVIKTDPITFAADEIGHYAVHVCANDLAVAGAIPRYYLPTVLLPAGRADRALVERIFAQIGAACRSLGVVVAGGHSEVTSAVNQPVVAGAMLGETSQRRFVHSGGCNVGDLLLLAGSVPLEAASIIARERRADLLRRGWSAVELDKAAGYLFAPGISVARPALAVATLVTAMHDPTEGGVATGLAEMALASRVGLEIDLDAIPTPDLAQRLCAAYGMDPLGAISSGALLAAARPDQAEAVLGAWAACGWPGAVIGRCLPVGEGRIARRGGQIVAFPSFAVDELTKLAASGN
jgi:hydrogenase maturation factor